jgi:hypothetical protein
MKNVDVLNVYGAMEQLLDKEIDVELAFRLADIISKLEPKQKAITMVMQRIEKDENGNPNDRDFQKLLAQDAGIEVKKFSKKELTDAFDKLNIRTLLALKSILIDD